MLKLLPLIGMMILPAIQMVVFISTRNYPMAGVMLGIAITNGALLVQATA